MHIIHDGTSSDLAYVTIIAENDDLIRMLDYVLIANRINQKRWLAQVVERARNLPAMGGDPLDPTILHGLELAQSYSDIRSIESRYLYRTLLLGEITDKETIQTATVGPRPAASVTTVAQADLFKYLNVPQFNDDAQKSNVIGLITNVSNAPLCFTADLFNTHVGVAGAIGCGKSNIGANLVKQGVNLNRCVLVHDVKPDYTRMREANSDGRVKDLWPLFAPCGLRPSGLSDVYSIGFYGACDPRAVDRIISLNASDFLPTSLAYLIFRRDEENQAEEFATAAEQIRQQRGERAIYSVADIVAYVDKNPDGKIHEKTRAAILSKVRRRDRVPVWLDKIGQTVNVPNSPKQIRVEHFDLETIARAGRVIHIAYDPGISHNDYAIIVGYFLRVAHRYCVQGNFKGGVSGLIQFIDEAHRIFDNTSSQAGSLINQFNRVMREGRSKEHSIVLLIQNIDQIPDGVFNNLSSLIVMRQNSLAMAKKATQNFGGDAYAAQALQLGTGQALVKLFESRAVLFAQMAPSPFELERPDNRRRTKPLSEL